jgi:hypothetical protein
MARDQGWEESGEAAFLDAAPTHCVVMPGLVPGIHVFGSAKQDVDGRDKPGHD